MSTLTSVLNEIKNSVTGEPKVTVETPLDEQPVFQGVITMQVSGHAVDEADFRSKMHELVAKEAVRPYVANGHLHGSLDQFQLELVRNLTKPETGRRRQVATIAVTVEAPSTSETECVAREAVGALYERRYVQGKVVGASLKGIS